MSKRTWTGILLALFAFLVFTPLTSTGQASRAYEVVITGIEDPGQVESLEQISDTFALQEKPLPVISLLQRRMEEDRELFLKWLRAEGYYGAEVTATVDPEAVPPAVEFRIDTGPPFLLASVALATSSPGLELPGWRALGLELNRRFRTADLLAAEKELLRLLKNRGYPFPRIADRRVVADHATRTVSVTLQIDPGPFATFGSLDIVGLEEVEQAFVLNAVPWNRGDPFDAELLDKLRNRLIASKVFSTARVTTPRPPDETGSLPVTITVTEREHRSFGVGASYKTDEGPGFGISWEHRNLFHGGEQLGFSAGYSSLTLTGEAGFLKPYFLRKDQSLRLSAKLAEDTPDAYTSRYFKTGLGVRRDFSDEFWVGGGIDFKASRVTQLETTESFEYVSFPFGFELDRSDALLDPTRGYRVGMQVSLYEDFFQSNPTFTKGSLRLRGYVPVLQSPSLVLAGAVNGGALAGSDRDDVPADERFYAGGGGSIRGYAYQSVGPRREDTPVGGRSLLEVSLEGRLKLTDRFGLVIFFDGGNAYESRFPDFSESFLWGAGAGFRYYTPVGPFRFDIAFPLDRRDGIDDSFQIYISLGQAF